MNNDGVREGYDIEQLAAVRAVVNVPVIASGGAGDFTAILLIYFSRQILMEPLPHRCSTAVDLIPKLKAYLRAKTDRSEVIVMPDLDIGSVDWEKGDGLVPPWIQNVSNACDTARVYE